MMIAFTEKKPFRALSGTEIFKKNEPIHGLGLILQGTVEAVSEYGRLQLGVGSVIGLMDVSNDGYYFDYIVKEDATIYPFIYNSEDDITKITGMGTDYPGAIIISLTLQVLQLIKMYETLINGYAEICEFLKKYNSLYKRISKDYFVEYSNNKEIDSLEILDKDYFISEEGFNYYKSLSKIPANIQKSFFASSENVTITHITMASEHIGKIDNVCKELIKYFNKAVFLLVEKGVDSLFTCFTKLALEIGRLKGNNASILNQIDIIIEKINHVDEIYTEVLSLSWNLDREWMQDLYSEMLSLQGTVEVNSDVKLSYSQNDITSALESLDNSTEKILEYGEIEKEKSAEFVELINIFRSIRGKSIGDDESRRLRIKISELFYDIYEKVFFRAEEDKNNNNLIEMFLNFGFVDEKMFDQEQLLELYYLDISPVKNQIYTIRQWLHAIYTKKREPSINEFGFGYKENLKELKKTKNLTAEEEQAYLNNQKGKVHYEISNLFRLANRMTSGHITSFFPILYKESFIRDIKNTLVNKDQLYLELEKLVQIDFSAFHRESLYQDKNLPNEYEYVMKRVMPDIILFPNVGSKGIMWQEISEKKRDTPARFLFPIFTIEELEMMILKVMGNYRWEFCKTVHGVRWNDPREKSLTAEYYDYLQFYKKNRDLTDVAKEKIKSQMQNNRNNYRNMFTKDYEIWMKYESLGTIRLNKVVRNILATYCPFNSEIREKLGTQPAFSEGFARYQRETSKKVKELNNKYLAIQKKGLELPKALEDNLVFYKEM